MPALNPIYIALGANLSNPKATFLSALGQLSDQGVVVKAVSGLWQSPAWPPGSGQPDYINACAEIDLTERFGPKYIESEASHPAEHPAHPARRLLALLHGVERDFGRVRSERPEHRNAARALDLDLLDFRGLCLSDTEIQIPHPRMLTRGFVLFPLSEIAPHWRDPLSGREITAFIARLSLEDVAPMQWLGRVNPLS